MIYKLDSFQDLIEAFKMFPGIGTKTAERMALFLMKSPPDRTRLFSKSVQNARGKIHFCSVCYLFTEEDPCQVCQDSQRDQGLICVIEEAKDAFVLERCGFRGLYHVLMGKISPLDGVGPEDLKVAHLVERIKKIRPREVILATGMDVEGEATALYLSKLLGEEEVKLTRIAYGIPVGMGLDYADELTLAKALEARRSL
ncbi:MAG: recombination protein RecR [Chlamydiae bacterium]|nr:recombination protein RecR [Chlamydiota bacterium]MBI3278024.1 recombination protein RecR [Chlamydiota bacterium]